MCVCVLLPGVHRFLPQCCGRFQPDSTHPLIPPARAPAMIMGWVSRLPRCCLLEQFIAIQIAGLNQGLAIGVGLSTLFFVISYASERR